MILAAPSILAENPNRPVRRAMCADRQHVVLAFAGEASDMGGAYMLRGGLAWPRLITGEGVRGYGVLCGRNERTGMVLVFEEYPFVTVDWLRHGQTIDARHAPLAPFLAHAWHYYLAKTFYWRPLNDQQFEYPKEIHRCESVMPKPVLPRLDWRDEGQEWTRAYVLMAQNRLAYNPDGGVAEAAKRYGAAKGGDYPVELEALSCALAGLARIPSEDVI